MFKQVNATYSATNPFVADAKRHFRREALITKEKLQAETAKTLAQMAAKQGVPGARGMRKDDLIKKLLQAAKKQAAAKTAGQSQAKKPSKSVDKISGATANTKTRAADRGVAVKKTRGSSPAAASTVSSTAKPQPTAAGKSKSVASKPAAAAKSAPAKSTTKRISQTKPVAAVAKTTGRVSQVSAAKGAAAKVSAAKVSADTSAAEKVKSLHNQRTAAKDLAFFRQQLSTSEEPKKDRLVLFVRDPYWVQAYWEITTGGVERAKAALAEHWHTAVPVLRLLVNQEDSIAGASEQMVQEIKIHGGVNNWYIPVQNPPQAFRAVIGYLAPTGRFHALAQSNLVRTPVPGSSDHVDYNWTDLADIGDRVFSLSGGFSEGASAALREVFEEKLSRPMNRSALSRYGTADVPGKMTSEDFFVDAELLIFGKTHRSAEVSISGEPVKVREDGSFTVRVGLPDKRQVFPVSSTSFDGSYTFTTVLAIERNTKVMEPMSMEPGEDF